MSIYSTYVRVAKIKRNGIKLIIWFVCTCLSVCAPSPKCFTVSEKKEMTDITNPVTQDGFSLYVYKVASNVPEMESDMKQTNKVFKRQKMKTKDKKKRKSRRRR